jgi:hypothetical protein
MNARKQKIVKLAVIAGLLLASGLVMLYWKECAFHVVCFFSKPYDKDFYRKNYLIEGNGKIFIIDLKDGKRYSIKRTFRDSFEDAASIRDLMGIERGWTTFTLQSPKFPTVTDYNKLKDQILKSESSFLDNRVEPTSEQAHDGKQSLKTLAVAPGSMSCTKASLSTMLLHFVKGDDVWFSAWYYFETTGKFNTVMDLETTFARGHPGMRICLNNGYLHFELGKWVPNCMYRQNEKPGIPFPVKRWVHIKTRLRLSEGSDGIVQLWQDGKLIIDQRGQTLPFADAVYNDLEIGLSAHSDSPNSAVLYVDDVVISDNPIEDR